MYGWLRSLHNNEVPGGSCNNFLSKKYSTPGAGSPAASPWHPRAPWCPENSSSTWRSVLGSSLDPSWCPFVVPLDLSSVLRSSCISSSPLPCAAKWHSFKELKLESHAGETIIMLSYYGITSRFQSAYEQTRALHKTCHTVFCCYFRLPRLSFF